MQNRLIQSLFSRFSAATPGSTKDKLQMSSWSLALAMVVLSAIAGCGSGGYPGGGITAVSASAVTIDSGQTYKDTAMVTGGAVVSWTLAGQKCTGAACGTLSSTTGASITYTAPPELTTPMVVTLSAVIAGTPSSAATTITVNPDPAISGIPPVGTVGVAYSTTLVTTPGTNPMTLSLTAGTLPPGLTFNATTGVIAGTPTSAGVFTVTAQLVDSSATPFTVTASERIVINTPVTVLAPLVLMGNPPSGTVGTPYVSALTATGGAPPYAFTQTSGTLPPGLTLSATGLLSGTPISTGNFTFTAQVKDSVGTTAAATFTIAIVAAGTPLTLSSPPNATVGTPYVGTIGVAGGKGPYTCVILSGTLPAGLISNSCVISGTPTTPGTTVLTVTATDSSNPAETTTGPVTLTVLPAAAVLTLSNPPAATINVPYTGNIGVIGGTAPYTCQIVAGTLQAGLTATNCTISGTPTTSGAVTVTVKATDSSSPANTVTAPVTVTVNPATATLALSNPPNATVNVLYSGTIGVAGGTAPYVCQILAGTLPAGLVATNCTISGITSVAGPVTLTVKATDSSAPSKTVTGPVSFTVNPASATLTLSNPPNATVSVPYSGLIGVAGGTAPYTCQILAGTLPTGLTATNCTISGTTTVAGPVTLTVKATDSSAPTPVSTTGTVIFTVNAASATLTVSPPPNATVQTPYTGTIPVAGGTAPYNCTIAAGTLPPGLSNNGCVVTGTPTTAGSTTVTVTATDSSSPVNTTTAPVTITILPLSPVTLTGSLPNGTLGLPYTQTLTAQGGLSPYTYTLTAGTLPLGITLSKGGVISGTPTAVGASSFTVTATDSQGNPQSASLPLVLLVVYPTTATDSEFKGPYAFLFQGYDDVVAGVLAYQTATVGSFTADGTGVISAGELDANHQASVSTGTTVTTNIFVGTYTLTADSRGQLTITTFNAKGTIMATTTYAFALKAPVVPATLSVQGDLIEYDANQLVGTKGSGTLLAQTTASFAAGLTGSYAFGVAGDTPCLPACTLNVAGTPVAVTGGPAAAVGVMTTNAGAITGTGDSNVGATYSPSSVLTGSYGVADINGRVQLAMATSGTLAGIFPTDYAVYMVSASQAYVLSTDKHSAYILLAGSAQLQTQATFSNASMTGAFVGYEDAEPNPGLVGSTLQGVLNFSTATIFQGSDTGNGTCTINRIDTGGVTALTTQLTGLGGSLTGLTAILSGYSQPGTTTCPVAINGRGTLQYPEPTLLGVPLFTAPAPRVFYLSSPNAGYFLETGYAAVGKLEAQAGAPFTLANTFTGTYVYGSAPASSLASIDSSGYIASNGAGQATSTLDKNIGVGTINVLELGVTSTSPYTAPDAYGRFTLGASGVVIYTITPNRFVLLDTNALTTSPSVAVLF